MKTFSHLGSVGPRSGSGTAGFHNDRPVPKSSPLLHLVVSKHPSHTEPVCPTPPLSSLPHKAGSSILLTWNACFLVVLIHFRPGSPLGPTLGLQAATEVPTTSGPTSSSLLLRLQRPGLGHPACCYGLLVIGQRLWTGLGYRTAMLQAAGGAACRRPQPPAPTAPAAV